MSELHSTYRLQVNADFGLARIHELVDYFRALGISHLYLSPLLQARPGSTHGYDVTDPAHVNPEIGSDEELESLSARLREHGMGLLLDIVPNHMSATEDNRWWRDLLEHGPASAYAGFFDIDWSADPPGEGRVMLPVLGQELKTCLNEGQLRLTIDRDLPCVAYFDRTFPIDPSTYDQVVAVLNGASRQQREELSAVAIGARDLPLRTDSVRVVERRERAHELKERLANVLRSANAVDQLCAEVTGDRLHALLEAQPYALSFWLTGQRAINYRRFFDISDLVALRSELPDVFDAVHERPLRWLIDGTISGVRVDHIDGLRDPAAYLQLLHDRVRAASGKRPYVVVEKILVGSETLPSDWRTAGTTGYDFISPLNGVFVDPKGWKKLGDDYARRTNSPDFWTLVYEKKKLVMGNLFPSELQALGSLAASLSRESSASDLHCALLELTACLRVYRTYVTDRDIRDSDRELIEQTFEQAEQHGAPAGAVADLRRLLTQPKTPEERELVLRWQLFTGPVMAKGMEDTAFYNYHRLISACEVGSDPSAAAVTVEEFHGRMQRRQADWPRTMNASSTHDTKRSQDVRARINVLSELTDPWLAFLDRWIGRRNAYPGQVEGVSVPEANEELLLYQTLLGAWPLFEEDWPTFEQRIRDYAIKAVREAKRHTSWRKQNQLYEAAVLDFVSSLLRDDAFLTDLRVLQKQTAFFGALTSLSHLVLELGAPGVPDFYQGTELWALTLVDPDNRRPVDYALRDRLLRERSELAELMRNWRDGRIKLFLIQRGLDLRNRAPDLFASGEYRPIEVSGKRSDHLIAFERRLADRRVLFLAARFYSRLCKPEVWPDISLWEKTRLLLDAHPGRQWRSILDGRAFSAETPPAVSQLLDPLPFGIFELV